MNNYVDQNMHATSPTANEGISTTSRLRMWWLTTVQGYRLVNIKVLPAHASFGRIRYERTWWLKRDEDT